MQRGEWGQQSIALRSFAPQDAVMNRDKPAGASRLDAMDVDEYLRDPSRKQQFVTPMFDLIAPVYDRFTRVFSFGMDARWKEDVLRSALQSISVGGGGRVLDLACGTGDLALAIGAARPGATVVGVDASPRMIEQARLRGGTDANTPNVSFQVGDLGKLTEPTGSADLVVASYAYRNVPDWRAGLAETARVIKPGGTFVSLDFYRPEQALWRALFLGYLRVAGDLVGLAWHGRPVVYGYIARSIAAFASSGAFARGLRDAGFSAPAETRFLGGGVAIHTAVREAVR